MTNFSENIKNLILTKLEEIATPKKKAREMAFFKYRVSNIIGTGVKPMRAVVAKFIPELKDKNNDEIIAVATALMETEIYEAQLAAVEIMYQFKNKLNLTEAFELAAGWIESGLIDNWAAVDDIAKYVMSYALMENIGSDLRKTTYRWTKSKNHWMRRASLVAYIIPARESLYFETIYKTAKKLMKDDNEYVIKAVGWLLREAGESDKRRLENFVFKYGKEMRRVVLRSAIEKFPEEERNFLMSQTKTVNYLAEQYKNMELENITEDGDDDDDDIGYDMDEKRD